MVISVPESDRESILAKLKERGVTEVDGVPVEEIIVAINDAPAAFEKARERARASLG